MVSLPALAQRGRSGAPLRQAARPYVLPSATGGWNTRDALDAMDPRDAVTLDNWYPGLGSVAVRPGSTQYATGMGSGAVETLAEYHSASTRKFLAASGGGIYDISSTGAVGAALASGFASNRWQTVNFKGVQIWVNGTDTEKSFDGASFTNWGVTGPVAGTIVGVAVFKSFLFCWTNSSQDFWYLAVDAITGPATKFRLSEVSELGGNLIGFSTISITGGANDPDDLACFFMSSGECIVFQGTDPGNAAAWALVGRYRIGTPVGSRAIARYGGDTIITTLTDHTSLNAWFGALRQGIPPALSKVSGAVLAATSAGAALFGWQSVMFPGGGKMLANVPNADGTFHQHVLNTVTGAWCRYTGLAASCWGLYRDLIYFGGAAGKVYQAEVGNSDAGSVAIAADGQQAWSPLGMAGNKLVSLFRPLIASAGTVTYEAGVGYDYQAVNVGAAISTAPSGAAWDTSPWDTTSWAGSVTDLNWRVAGGAGQDVSVRVRVSALQAIQWQRTDFRVIPGAGL